MVTADAVMHLYHCNQLKASLSFNPLSFYENFPFRKWILNVCGHWHNQQMLLASGVAFQPSVSIFKLDEWILGD